MMMTGLSVEYVWDDPDILEVRIAACNGEFRAKARAYIDPDHLKNAASILEGFPRSPDDSRELDFGTMDPQFAGGGASLRFFCKDARGQAVVEIRIRDEERPETTRWSRPDQTARFYADVEASAIDEFVRELKEFDASRSGSANLRF